MMLRKGGERGRNGRNLLLELHAALLDGRKVLVVDELALRLALPAPASVELRAGLVVEGAVDTARATSLLLELRALLVGDHAMDVAALGPVLAAARVLEELVANDMAQALGG